MQITQLQGEKWYYFRAKYNFCSAIDSIQLGNRTIKYTRQNVAVCEGEKATLNLNVQTASQYGIIWYTNTDTIETNNISSIEITPSSSQTVYFHIDNLYGCAINDSLQITLNIPPGIDAFVDKPIIYRGEQVQLSATQGQGYSYNWTPAALVSNASIYNPVSSPVQTTLYTIVVSNNNQCRTQDTVTVQVIQYECIPSSIYIPNAFSPNGDGVNDTFKVRTATLKSMHLEVYDRWGHKVFETDNITDGWNGTYKGQPAPFDAYGYYFSGECLQGEKISLKGNVTLLR